MKKFEKFIIALIVLWVLEGLSTGLLPFFIFKIAEHPESTSYLKTLAAILSIIKSMGIALICGAWLFLEAKRESQSQWLWCLAGLVLRTHGVVLFFVWLTFLELRHIRTTNPP